MPELCSIWPDNLDNAIVAASFFDKQGAAVGSAIDIQYAQDLPLAQTCPASVNPNGSIS